ncbi:PDZ domain-containing protein, partial [bacterium]|nr:PDZ domain-containing protein [bacterium]
VRIRHVFADSPASKAGIEVDDVVIACNEKPVGDAGELLDVVSRIRPDEKVTVTFKRGDDEQTANVKIGSIPSTIAGELKDVLIPPPNVDFGDDPDAKKEGEEAGEQADDKDPEPEDAEATETSDAAADKAEGTEPPVADKSSLPKTGRFTEELEAHKHNFWAYVPDDYNPAYGYSLMVCVHPPGDTMEAIFMDSWKPVCDRRGIILVGPKAEKPSGFSLNEAEFVVDCVKLMMERYNVDPARVALHGYGQGGDYCWHLAFKEREIFRGVQVTAAGLRTPPPDNRPDFRLQVHMLCSLKDRVNRIVQGTMAGLKRFKYPVTFTELLTTEREYPAMDYIEEAGRWIDSLDRI